jgi:hypothetical protein
LLPTRASRAKPLRPHAMVSRQDETSPDGTRTRHAHAVWRLEKAPPAIQPRALRIPHFDPRRELCPLWYAPAAYLPTTPSSPPPRRPAGIARRPPRRDRRRAASRDRPAPRRTVAPSLEERHRTQVATIQPEQIEGVEPYVTAPREQWTKQWPSIRSEHHDFPSTTAECRLPTTHTGSFSVQWHLSFDCSPAQRRETND